ncbi:MAG: hypothetical protein KatS3mg022_1015 [Armatimonadota bacterium]|nr:MAG: hypothetical protein KatS3mg022_1015 [Armatimonadota bacterium]
MKRQSQHTLLLTDKGQENNETLEAQLMRALQEREEQESILASIPSILITVDEHDRVTHWNPAAEKTFGIPSSQALGQRLQQCPIQWDWQPVIQGITACRKKCAPVKLDDLRYTRIDGHEGIIGITLNPLGNSAEANGRVLLLGADITERRLMERQFAQALKMESIGRLAAGIAHEINTPTQYVGDNIRFLQEAMRDLIDLLRRFQHLLECTKRGTVSAEQITELEQAIDIADLEYLLEEIPKAITQSLEGVDRVAKIVRAMKEFSHPGAAEMTSVDLNHALESTITVARNEWKYVADMVTDFDPNLPPVPCLPGDINQVFLNIIVNAAHAIADVVGDGSRGKGTITVSTRALGDWVEVRISDTGTGIPEAIRSKIFDPFFTTKQIGRGTGQGLAYVHSVVVEKHKGIITFETEEGKGTTFIIRLPLHQEQDAKEEAA